MLGTIRSALAREDGASAVEYGLLIAAIAAIIVGVVFLLGSRVKSTFSKTNSCIGASSTTC
jgi:pilus assembly protein Flp/PilA